jgi:hypothetical protein
LLGQFTTPGPSFCPAGYSLIPGAQINVIPSSPTAAQLSTERAAMCQNASGQALEDVQGTPLGIALLVGAGLAILFLPGLWKIVALPMAFEGYCSMNNQKCIVSL